MAKTPEEIREANTKGKQKSRKAKAEHNQKIGLEPFNMEMGRGTREALERIMAAGEFEVSAEAVTVLIHNADEILKRDMSQVDCLLNVTWLRSRELS
ncbi:MAG: hypothetical protein V7731_16125 [Amphritea sp.]